MKSLPLKLVHNPLKTLFRFSAASFSFEKKVLRTSMHPDIVPRAQEKSPSLVHRNARSHETPLNFVGRNGDDHGRCRATSRQDHMVGVRSVDEKTSFGFPISGFEFQQGLHEQVCSLLVDRQHVRVWLDDDIRIALKLVLGFRGAKTPFVCHVLDVRQCAQTHICDAIA